MGVALDDLFSLISGKHLGLQFFQMAVSFLDLIFCAFPLFGKVICHTLTFMICMSNFRTILRMETIQDLAELTLHDFGGYGEVSFYALGQDILTYDVTFEGAYAFSGYTVDYFQFDDYEGIQDLLIFRSGTQEWLVTWNDHHKDGAVYTYEP